MGHGRAPANLETLAHRAKLGSDNKYFGAEAEGNQTVGLIESCIQFEVFDYALDTCKIHTQQMIPNAIYVLNKYGKLWIISFYEPGKHFKDFSCQ